MVKDFVNGVALLKINLAPAATEIPEVASMFAAELTWRVPALTVVEPVYPYVVPVFVEVAIMSRTITPAPSLVIDLPAPLIGRLKVMRLTVLEFVTSRSLDNVKVPLGWATLLPPNVMFLAAPSAAEVTFTNAFPEFDEKVKTREAELLAVMGRMKNEPVPAVAQPWPMLIPRSVTAFSMAVLDKVPVQSGVENVRTVVFVKPGFVLLSQLFA